MKVTLDHHTPLNICSSAIRQCWQSQGKSDNGGPADRDLIDRIGNKYKHASTLEHLSYNFTISGVSRALLQELARHRMASPSVQSTRYTLAQDLKHEAPFLDCSTLQDTMDQLEWHTPDAYERASKYLVFTGELPVDIASIQALDNLRELVSTTSIANDKLKYCLPESFKLTLAWTINARSLQNFLSLRSSKAALWEIRDLAQAIFDSLPEDHKYLFEHCLEP
jgi:thymidylate synthase (FAD)